MMARVVVADGLDAEAISMLKQRYGAVAVKPTELPLELADAEILIVRSKTKVNKELLALAPKLKAVARAGVGMDNIDVPECEKRGVKAFNTPDASTNAVAEFTVALMLALARRVPYADCSMKGKRWEKDALQGTELSGKSIGIVGYGRIGSSVADRLRAFGCKILAFSLEYLKEPGNAEVVSLEDLLKRADFVTLHIPLTEQTRNLISRERMALMKRSAYIVNTSRGEVLDLEALHDALINNRLAGAAIDVFPHEPYSGDLCALKNAIITPHIAGSTHEGQARIGMQIVETLATIVP